MDCSQSVEEAAMREPNLEKLNALVGKLVGDLGISLGGASILLGDRLEPDDAGPFTFDKDQRPAGAQIAPADCNRCRTPSSEAGAREAWPPRKVPTSSLPHLP